MALKAVLESLEGINEAIAAEYIERDGKFLLNVEAVGGIELVNATNLKSALQKERTDRSSLETELKKFEGLDVDVAAQAIKTLEELGDLEALTDLDEKLKVREDQMRKKYENETTQLQAKYEKDIETATGKIGTLRKQLSETLIRSAASKAIAESNGSIDLLLPVIETRSRMSELDDGSLQVEILDNEGVARISPKSGSTSPMTISELVDEMKGADIFARAFDASGHKGTGTPPGGTNRGKSNSDLSEIQNPVERLKEIRRRQSA